MFSVLVVRVVYVSDMYVEMNVDDLHVLLFSLDGNDFCSQRNDYPSRTKSVLLSISIETTTTTTTTVNYAGTDSCRGLSTKSKDN